MFLDDIRQKFYLLREDVDSFLAVYEVRVVHICGLDLFRLTKYLCRNLKTHLTYQNSYNNWKNGIRFVDASRRVRISTS
jgi:hypothetical protein